LIDVPAAQHPVGVYVGDDLMPPVTTNIAVQNNLILGPANPAVMVDTTNPSPNVIVEGNLAMEQLHEKATGLVLAPWSRR